ncbi:MAG: hypothetical protein AAGI08_11720, partial [Bacteroidota bacterium]
GPWQIEVRNEFMSEVFRLNERLGEFRDENRARWRIGRPVGGNLLATAYGYADSFSQNQAAEVAGFVGVRLPVRDLGWVEPAVGFVLDRRLGALSVEGNTETQTDTGPAVGFRALARSRLAPNLQATLGLESAWQWINPRQGRTVVARGAVQRVDEASRLVVDVGASSYRRDAYQAASFLNRDPTLARSSETIEATISDTLRVAGTYEQALRPALALRTRLDVGLNRRLTRIARAPEGALFFDTDFSRRALDADVTLAYDRTGRRLVVGVQAGAEVERRTLANRDDLPPDQARQKGDLIQQADYDAGVYGLTAEAAWPVLRWLTGRLSWSARLLRHDTPEANDDDRDELLHTLDAGLRLQLRETLTLDLAALGSFDHTVYLRAARSAENNRRFSLRLRPVMRWTPSARTRLRFESAVRATYTVDDFQIEGQTPNDQSARELRYAGQFEHQFDDGLAVLADGTFSDLLLGRLLWEQFAEIPFDTLRTVSGWVRVRAGRQPAAEIGVRAFVRRDFDRATTVQYTLPGADGAPGLETTITRPGREWIEQVGPTASLTWETPSGSVLRIDGWIQFQRVRQVLFGTLPENEADRIRAAARRGVRRVVPNVTARVVWQL